MLNVNFNQFKSGYLKKKNQVLFFSINTKGEQEIINLINNLLIEKNSFVFESVEKGKIKGKSIRLDSGAIVDAEITYEILAIEDGSSINGIVKKIVNSTPTKKQILPEDKKKEDKKTN